MAGRMQRDFHHGLSRRNNAMHIFLIVLAMLLAAPSPSDARVTRIEIERVESPTFDGRSFGDVGPYEKLVGRVHAEVDPDAPENAVIADIELAPRNARGMVEYSADLIILRPVDPARGQRPAVLRNEQPRPAALAEPPQQRTDGQQRPDHGRRRRQRLPDAPGLHVRGQRLGRDGVVCRRPAERHAAGGGEPRRVAHRRAIARRAGHRQRRHGHRPAHVSGGDARHVAGDADGAHPLQRRAANRWTPAPGSTSTRTPSACCRPGWRSARAASTT